MLTTFCQAVINGFGTVLTGILSVLPSSPFTGFYNLVLSNELLGFIACIIPVSEILALLQAWLVAVSTFYLWSIVLRWIKAIE